MFDLQKHLAEITGLPAVTLQPAAGAQGELTGMLLFYAFHMMNKERRTKILIPDTAHGTNPASAALCGFRSIPVASNTQGVLSADDVQALMDEDTAGIMVTNPNTLGLFEEHIKQISEVVHAKGGLVYADGANMNAVMGMVTGRPGCGCPASQSPQNLFNSPWWRWARQRPGLRHQKTRTLSAGTKGGPGPEQI